MVYSIGQRTTFKTHRIRVVTYFSNFPLAPRSAGGRGLRGPRGVPGRGLAPMLQLQGFQLVTGPPSP